MTKMGVGYLCYFPTWTPRGYEALNPTSQVRKSEGGINYGTFDKLVIANAAIFFSIRINSSTSTEAARK